MAITHKKIKLALILLAVGSSHLALAQITSPETNTLQKNASGEDPLEAASSQASLEKNAMVWSLVPGESVSRLAKLFYPKDKAMQQLFVVKTLYLSRKIQPELRSNTTSSQTTLIVIPNIKQLSQQSLHAVLTQKNYPNATRSAKARATNEMQFVVLEVSPKIQFIYDELIKKNEFLKLEINKLNVKLAYLEQILVTLKADILRFVASNQLQADSEIKAKLKVQAHPEMSVLSRVQASKLPDASQNPAFNTGASQEILSPSMAAKSTFDSSYLLLSIFNFLLVTSCLIGFILFSRRQAKAQTFLATNKVAITKSEEIRKKSLMIKEKLDTQKQIKIIRGITPAVLGEFTHSMPGAEEKSAAASDLSPEKPEAVHELSVKPVKPAVVPEEATTATVSPMMEPDQAYDKEQAELLLGQAKIFVQVDRAGYAIRLLKAQIQSAPKSSIQHWLYLLDIYRQTNQKAEFLLYAEQLHQNFNVMMPLWEHTLTPMVSASCLEEYSHITEKVTKLWADCKKEVNSIMQTKAYLDELLTDNRDSQRTGFSMEVFEEIILLRTLLDEREEAAVMEA